MLFSCLLLFETYIFAINAIDNGCNLNLRVKLYRKYSSTFKKAVKLENKYKYGNNFANKYGH